MGQKTVRTLAKIGAMVNEVISEYDKTKTDHIEMLSLEEEINIEIERKRLERFNEDPEIRTWDHADKGFKKNNPLIWLKVRKAVIANEIKSVAILQHRDRLTPVKVIETYLKYYVGAPNSIILQLSLIDGDNIKALIDFVTEIIVDAKYDLTMTCDNGYNLIPSGLFDITENTEFILEALDMFIRLTDTSYIHTLTQIPNTPFSIKVHLSMLSGAAYRHMSVKEVFNVVTLLMYSGKPKTTYQSLRGIGDNTEVMAPYLIMDKLYEYNIYNQLAFLEIVMMIVIIHHPINYKAPGTRQTLNFKFVDNAITQLELLPSEYKKEMSHVLCIMSKNIDVLTFGIMTGLMVIEDIADSEIRKQVDTALVLYHHTI